MSQQVDAGVFHHLRSIGMGGVWWCLQGGSLPWRAMLFADLEHTFIDARADVTEWLALVLSTNIAAWCLAITLQMVFSSLVHCAIASQKKQERMIAFNDCIGIK